MVFCESQGLPTQNRSGSLASNASNKDADDNNSSSFCTQSRIDKWKAKHEAARFVVILVLVRGIRGRATGSVLGTKAEAACRLRLMRHLTPWTIFQIFFFKISWFPFQGFLFWLGERSLMTSHIRVGRGVQEIAPQKGRYRVGHGRLVKNGQKTWDVPKVFFKYLLLSTYYWISIISSID